MERRWPTRNGIAVPIYELNPPPSRTREKNNHHREHSARAMGRFAVTQTLRDLERLQEMTKVDQHRWAHNNFAPPDFPTFEQATIEIADAFDNEEQLKIYDRYARCYIYQSIPQDLVDGYIAQYGLGRVIFDMAAD